MDGQYIAKHPMSTLDQTIRPDQTRRDLTWETTGANQLLTRARLPRRAPFPPLHRGLCEKKKSSSTEKVKDHSLHGLLADAHGRHHGTGGTVTVLGAADLVPAR